MSLSPPDVSAPSATELRGALGSASLFALAFGSIIGSGWLVLLGSWLSAAGPSGAIIGFLAGGLVMVLIAACYAELSCRLPETGGEFIYALRILGPRTAFGIGWFILLYFIAVTVFEALALAFIAETLAPAFKFPVLYSLFSKPITLTAVMIGIVGAISLGALNYRGVEGAATFQRFMTYGFLIVACALLIYAAVEGSTANLTIPFASETGNPWWYGSAWIFANCAFLLNGFQAIPMAIEERSQSLKLRKVAKLIILSVICATLFYCFVILSGAVAQPWREVIGADLAISSVLSDLPNSDILITVILLAGAASLLKAWNSMMLMASRLMLAMVRAGFLPAALGTIHPRFAVPARAVVVVVILNIAGVFLGRGAIEALINMCSIMLVFAFVICCVALLKVRAQSTEAADFSVPGGTTTIIAATLGALAMAVSALVSPLLEGRFPVEWLLILLWATIGFFAWLYNEKRKRKIRVMDNKNI